MEPSELIITAARLWVGAVMLAHGLNHARNLEGTASWFARKGFRQARPNAALSAFGEIAIGVALLVGLGAPFAAAGVVTTMTVAFWSIHRHAGFFVFKRPDEGWEYVATLAVLALVIAGVGPGPWSIDAALGIEIAGWCGLLIATAGFAVAAIQLALFWRYPENRAT